MQSAPWLNRLRNHELHSVLIARGEGQADGGAFFSRVLSMEAMREQANTLHKMGMRSAVGKKLGAATLAKFDIFNRKVFGRLALVYYANNLETLKRAQELAMKMARDTKKDDKIRATCLAIVAHCGQAIAVAGASSMRVLNESEERTPDLPPPPKREIVDLEAFPFPPVVTRSQ